MSAETLVKAKNLEETSFGFNKYLEAILNIAKGNTITNFSRGFAALFIYIGYNILRKIIKDMRIELSGTLSEAERQELKLYLTKINDNNDDNGIDSQEHDY